MIIAVDGPTASGKGTIAKRLAAHFGVPHLDTGLLYRAVGRQVALNEGDPDNEAHALAGCLAAPRQNHHRADCGNGECTIHEPECENVGFKRPDGREGRGNGQERERNARPETA